jgi:hypothetical protein
MLAAEAAPLFKAEQQELAVPGEVRQARQTTQLQQTLLRIQAEAAAEVVINLPVLLEQRVAPVSSSSNTVYRHNPFMSSVDQPLGLLPQVQHRWIM